MESLTIYGRKGCARCRLVCSFLAQKGREFNYVDVETLEPFEERDLIDKAYTVGARELPIIVYNGNIIKDIKEIF